VFRVSGKGAADAFEHEAGGHRWQRVPPTEKCGRVQTSTVTVAVLHKPSGIKVRVDGGRSQHINRDTALGLLRARLKAAGQAQVSGNRKARRKAQVGTGMRADKIRTIALQRDQATNHLNGRSISAKKYLRGFVGDLT
jgi:peptide chain release factor 1